MYQINLTVILNKLTDREQKRYVLKPKELKILLQNIQSLNKLVEAMNKVSQYEELFKHEVVTKGNTIDVVIEGRVPYGLENQVKHHLLDVLTPMKAEELEETQPSRVIFKVMEDYKEVEETIEALKAELISIHQTLPFLPRYLHLTVVSDTVSRSPAYYLVGAVLDKPHELNVLSEGKVNDIMQIKLKTSYLEHEEATLIELGLVVSNADKFAKALMENYIRVHQEDVVNQSPEWEMEICDPKQGLDKTDNPHLTQDLRLQVGKLYRSTVTNIHENSVILHSIGIVNRPFLLFMFRNIIYTYILDTENVDEVDLSALYTSLKIPETFGSPINVNAIPMANIDQSCKNTPQGVGFYVVNTSDQSEIEPLIKQFCYQAQQKVNQQ